MLDKRQKSILRSLIRQAIKEANKADQFNCFDCKHCIRDGNKYICEDDIVPVLNKQKIVATRVPSCFFRSHVDSPYGSLIGYMIEHKLDTKNDYGWGTIVIRILRRVNYAGHFMNVRRDNLEKFSC